MDGLPHEMMPLDPYILALLPDEGSMLGKFHPMGRRIRDIVADLDDEHTTVSTVQTRCRIMKLNGLVVDVKGKGGRIWQRTTKGVQYLAENPIEEGAQ